MGFGKDLATGWGKPEEMIGCRKLKKNEKGVLESHTPLTSSHDDVIKNKKYTEIKLTALLFQVLDVTGSLQSSSIRSKM
jgi:hypothetical protein